MTQEAPSRTRLRRLRLLLWLLVAAALALVAALLLIERSGAPPETSAPVRSGFGGPFTLVGSDGKPFSSAKLTGKPYAIYFGFTRCGDVCPTTLSRMVKLRKEVGGPDKFNIVFVTIDPQHDGPKEVGQYAGLFNSPIIGLTGSQAEIDQVKKGVRGLRRALEASDGRQGNDAQRLRPAVRQQGKFVTTIAPDDPDVDALKKLASIAA